MSTSWSMSGCNAQNTSNCAEHQQSCGGRRPIQTPCWKPTLIRLKPRKAVSQQTLMRTPPRVGLHSRPFTRSRAKGRADGSLCPQFLPQILRRCGLWSDRDALLRLMGALTMSCLSASRWGPILWASEPSYQLTSIPFSRSSTSILLQASRGASPFQRRSRNVRVSPKLIVMCTLPRHAPSTYACYHCFGLWR
jgi:hypothetical protein